MQQHTKKDVQLRYYLMVAKGVAKFWLTEA